MEYQIGEKIGARVYGKVYVGTIWRASKLFYYLDIEGDEKGFVLSKSIDNVKPVCKSRSIVYV